ncbi:MAG: PAS domain S-box protein [Paludibacter sp.]
MPSLNSFESECHYKALFNNNHSVILLVNPENARIEDANPAACRFYGWTHDELCLKSVYDFNVIDKEQVNARLHAVESQILNHFITQHRLASSAVRDVEVFSNPIHIGNKTMIYSSIHDITEKRIAESELRKLSIAVEQSPVAICITNPDGIIEYVNPRVVHLTGFSANELINENTRIFGSGEKTKKEYTKLWQTIKSGKIWSGEFHNKKKDGELYWESATISPIFDNGGQITHFLSIKEDITDRKRAETALNKSEELLRKFASHLQNVREEEKVALAREIHDDLGQTLVALKIDMGLLKNKIVRFNAHDDSKNILEGFDNIVNMIDKTIKTARRIMSGLRPELLEINGFAGAASSYLREFEDRHQITCEFISETSGVQMSSQQSLVFFRILQESLSNIAKHSKATSVKIHFRNEPNKLILEIIDNGIGFDKNSSGRQDSYGMIGMKERAVLLNGELDIASEIGKGSCIRVEIPLDIN